MNTFLQNKFLILLACTLTACTPTVKNNEDEAAGSALNRARQAKELGHYAEAKQRILSMRELYPKAIETRKAAILTLDSVEMLLAADSMQVASEQMYEEQRNLKALEKDYTEHYVEYRKQEKRFNEAQDHFKDMEMKVRFYRKKLEIDSNKLSGQAEE